MKADPARVLQKVAPVLASEPNEAGMYGVYGKNNSDWKKRVCCFVASLVDLLIEALAGRTWPGKEQILEALSELFGNLKYT